jgi:hypothetical protein
MRKAPLPAPPGDYEIGYRKPPKHSRFKPGQSGNPRGRPKADKSLGAALIEALEAKVKLRRDGREHVVSSIQAFVLRVVTDAIQGKASAQKMLVELIARFVPTFASTAPTGNAEDTAAWLTEKFDLMAKRMQQKLPGEK